MIASLKSSNVTLAATWPLALSISRQALTAWTVVPTTRPDDGVGYGVWAAEDARADEVV